MALNQSYIFLIFIIDGILIGLLFDFFRIMRKSFKTSNILTYIEDIIFWTITGIIIIYTLYFLCDGEIRSYMFLGIIIGVCMYILTISKYIINISIKIIELIKRILVVILKPFILIYEIIKKIILKGFNFISIKYEIINFKLKKQ